MAQLQTNIPSTPSCVCQVRDGSHSSGPHHTSATRRGLLAWSIPSYVQELSHEEECEGASWYDGSVSWTWHEYYDSLVYISYDTKGVAHRKNDMRTPVHPSVTSAWGAGIKNQLGK